MRTRNSSTLPLRPPVILSLPSPSRDHTASGPAVVFHASLSLSNFQSFLQSKTGFPNRFEGLIRWICGYTVGWFGFLFLFSTPSIGSSSTVVGKQRKFYSLLFQCKLVSINNIQIVNRHVENIAISSRIINLSRSIALIPFYPSPGNNRMEYFRTGWIHANNFIVPKVKVSILVEGGLLV